jgi:glycosyltransferase involved in cell wall biosynthesis
MLIDEGNASRATRNGPAPDHNRLRVAVVSDAAAERNGVGTYYQDLVEHLRSRVAVAELFCPQGETTTRLQRYLTPPLPGDGSQRIWWPPALRLWRRLATIDPHALIVPTPGPYGMLGLLAARRLRIPLIVGFHTDLEALAEIYWSDRWGRLCRWYLESCHRLLFRHGRLVLVNSEEIGAAARELGARKVELMGTPIPREFVERPLAPSRPALERVLFAGRLAPEKNIDRIIELARACSELEVVIVGDGPLNRQVVGAARELRNLRFEGWVSRTDLIEYLDRTDLLLLPSRVESFGTVALEAMIRGRPALVSHHCGITQWPELRRGVFRIAHDETIIDAVRRLRDLPAAVRADRAQGARLAAARLNDWNIDSWMERLRRAGQSHERAA